jgi:hypothetical protein
MADPKQLSDIRLNDGESFVEALHDLRIRVEALEGNLLPAQQRAGYVAPLPDGSGTERYDGSGTGRHIDNWTQESDGTKYPAHSYGTGLEPFVPFEETLQSDTLAVGDSVRTINADGNVDQTIFTVSGITPDGEVHTQENDGSYPRNRVVQVIPKHS